jgi:hypothetical protein
LETGGSGNFFCDAVTSDTNVKRMSHETDPALMKFCYLNNIQLTSQQTTVRLVFVLMLRKLSWLGA